MGSLYKLTSPSGKSYIGISIKNADARWRQHRYNAAKGRGNRQGEECAALYGAMRAYGADKFVREVLAESESWSELCAMECRAILTENTLAPNGYNLTRGGDGAMGAIVSAESRKRMSDAQKRAMADPVLRECRKVALARAVDIRRANWWARSEAERAEWGLRHGPKVQRGWTQEVRDRKSIAARALGAAPAFRRKLSLSQTGVKKTPWTQERKTNASEAAKARYHGA